MGVLAEQCEPGPCRAQDPAVFVVHGPGSSALTGVTSGPAQGYRAGLPLGCAGVCQLSARAVRVPHAVGLSDTDPCTGPGLGLPGREPGLAQRPQQPEQEAPSWRLLT